MKFAAWPGTRLDLPMFRRRAGVSQLVSQLVQAKFLVPMPHHVLAKFMLFAHRQFTAKKLLTGSSISFGKSGERRNY